MCVSGQYALINPHKAIQLNTKVSLGKLPQVSFLLWQKFCHNKHMFVMTKHIFCCEKSMFAKTKCLSWQNYVCYDKIFLSQQNFGCKFFVVVTNTCLLQQKICHDKHTFVARKDVFCCDKHMFIMTKVSLSQQNFCCDKIMFVATNIRCDKNMSWQACFCHNKTCVLSLQKWYLWQLPPMIWY